MLDYDRILPLHHIVLCKEPTSRIQKLFANAKSHDLATCYALSLHLSLWNYYKSRLDIPKWSIVEQMIYSKKQIRHSFVFVIYVCCIKVSCNYSSNTAWLLS